ncbi:6-aminohexanoate hydrolase [Duganella sp. Leaf126]|uniref:serine hydrolase domain-containing protein n=1 Tax=Duganella sp. Leaf126 TaxID=1736266 RepID=UPI0006FD8A6C|nr:serine hydrolase [Duganella sp. Leaf126]KQQ40155.1 6-aminohexanoate hydrolase [Duganella sp. Leaf126]
MPNKLVPRLVIAAGALLVVAAGAALTLIGRPPQLLRVGAAYGAKIVCSNVFIAHRDAQDVLADDVQAPGHPLLKYLRVRVDRQNKTVHADFFGLLGQGLAVYRPGTGCAVVPDGDLAQASRYQYPPLRIWSASPNVPWPTGAMAETLPAIQAAVNDDKLAGPGMRGLVVIHRGRLVAQRYGDGFGVGVPLLGWSMTKTVTAALAGIGIADGSLAPGRTGCWADPADPRAQITLAQLMAMTSGLQFNEAYGDVSDVTRMLYLEPDMAAFAAAQPLAHTPGTVWQYASGSTVLLARIWQRAAVPTGSVSATGALALPHDQLFAPLGMSSAIIEADARGTLVGSSYMYATTQDWARFGQFLLQDGVWQGKRMLPPGFVAAMQAPVPASGGRYGQGLVWRQGPTTGPNADGPYGLPADTYWMQGHDGQSIAIVPSRQLVVVRLGLTPDALQYRPQALLAQVVQQVDAMPPPIAPAPRADQDDDEDEDDAPDASTAAASR